MAKSQPVVKHFFSSPSMYGKDSPTSWNGEVFFRQYRVTIELVEEPHDVLIARLRKLWQDEPYNTHCTDAFMKAAKELGITLDSKERGINAKSR